MRQRVLQVYTADFRKQQEEVLNYSQFHTKFFSIFADIHASRFAIKRHIRNKENHSRQQK